MNRRLAVIALLALLAAGLAACGGNDTSDSGAGPGPSPTKSLFTLTPIPVPPTPPPTGKLSADIEQSTRDGAANRFEVWIDNDTAAPIRPKKITYDDARFGPSLPGTRLREIPSQSRRGYPVYIPDQPACGQTAKHGTVTVTYKTGDDEKTTTVDVSDEAGVIDRVAGARCLELSIDQVADLSWADEVDASGDGGKGSTGTMYLVIDTTGQPGPTLVIDNITGNPVLSPGAHGVYDANLTITGTQPSQRVPIELLPTRCDAHAFAAAGNYGAFAVNVHVDGKPGQIILRMGVTAAKNAVDYARASCGFLTDG